jgi:hypothetical protein
VVDVAVTLVTSMLCMCVYLCIDINWMMCPHHTDNNNMWMDCAMISNIQSYSDTLSISGSDLEAKNLSLDRLT